MKWVRPGWTSAKGLWAVTKQRWVFFGPLPSVDITGLAVANECVVDGLKGAGMIETVIDTSWADKGQSTGRASLRKIGLYLRLFWQLWRDVRDSVGVYANLSATRFGLLKNAFVVCICKSRNVKAVFHYHGGQYREFYLGSGKLSRCLIRWVCGHADRILILDQFYYSHFRFMRDRRSNLRVVRNGVNGPIKARLSRPRITADTAEEVRLLYLSNLLQDKGYLQLIDAVSRIGESGQRVRLYLCGDVIPAPSDDVDIPDADGVHRYIGESDAGDFVEYKGRVTGSEKESLLDWCDAVILPSRGEGYALCLLEAFAYGRPAIATPFRAIRNMMDIAPIIPIEAVTAESIQQAILTFSDMDQDMLRHDARQAWENYFTVEQYQKQVVSVLDDVLRT